MNKLNRLCKTLVAGALGALCFLAPVSADTNYNVTLVNGQWVIQTAPNAQGHYQVFTIPAGNVQTPSHCPGRGVQRDERVVYSAPAAPFPKANPSFSLQSFEALVVEHTNKERARYGLAPVAPHAALTQAAEGHSQEMLDLNYFSHTSPTFANSSPRKRVNQAGANPRRVSENIFQASGHSTEAAARLAVESWMQSPGHRRNILDPAVTHIGVGLVEQAGTVSVTQMFAGGI